MKLIFLDESGFSHNWQNDISDQPFHVLAAFAINADSYAASCERLRQEINAIEEFETEKPLGQGFEVKAKEISAGKGYWKNHTKQRNEIRELMLGLPKSCKDQATAFLTAIDKKSLTDKYVSPERPDALAFRYMFERLQWYLQTENDFGVCVYDQTKFSDDELHSSSASLIRDGSRIQYWSNYYGHVVSLFKIDRVLELCLGRSENSIGLQVADYFAHFGYQYLKSGKPKECGWWATLKEGLHRKDGELKGIGLKVFP